MARRDAPGVYTWYELKVASNTPLYAAMELLVRGLLYLFTRRRLAELGYDAAEKELLRARMVRLCVLAPAAYYRGIDLGWLEAALNDGITRALAESPDLGVAVAFAFLAFPPTFAWPCEQDALRQALVQITRVYPQQ
jgi:hypothetical protein